ncbi:protein of unknown function DUF1616 [Methanofollis liminatans DSM 4140]|uniref:DUF1616 domain-containing protein n=1 Tax=Methanofollis liminatans DSM 4140 TaxID=28892 RepID=J1AT19_9EURY|nr:DUF1616 domain-containing protein [Methanofollis liminatans]EJG08233.1 protein of unknown function DUF1616 [Methanofollis liminatans DSM 4140]
MSEDKPAIVEALEPGAVPKDLVAIALWTVATVLCVYLPVLNTSVLRVVFGLPMVLFIPGYALIAALFPAKDDLDGIERVALSFGLSIAVVPLIGLALNYTPWGIRLDPILTALVIFTFAMIAAAHWRRVMLPQEKRFFVPFASMAAEARSELFPAESSRLDRALSVVLIVAIAAAIVTTVYVIVVPKEGEHFTEFYILGSGGKAADYPTDFFAGTEQSLIIGVGNHEYRNVTYTVEVLLTDQTFDTATNTSTVNKMERIGRFSLEIPHNTTVEEPYSFSIERTDMNRLQFLLFNETIPSDAVWGEDRIEASYRDLHLWVRVRPPVQ